MTSKATMSGCRICGRSLLQQLVTLAVLCLSARSAYASEKTHKYEAGEQVTLWVNNVGPYYNTLETYPYYRLPFCIPEGSNAGSERKRAGLGEILAGNDLRNSGYTIAFGKDLEKTVLCTITLDEDTTDDFKQAVTENYWFNMFLDDLPIFGMVGAVSTEQVKTEQKKYTEISSGGTINKADSALSKGINDSKDTVFESKEGQLLQDPVIWCHRRFDIAFNGDRIVEVNLSSDNPQPLKQGNQVQLTYEVHWRPSVASFDDRFDRYLDYDFFEHRVHWFSILNSFMLVMLLCVLVAMILIRTLRNDFAKYTRDDQEDEEGLSLTGNGRVGHDESGWKQVHGDVFRQPSLLMLFSALYGTGCQIITLVAGVVLFAIAGPLHGDVYEKRGEMITTIIVVYALTTFVAGYTSGSYYRQYFTTPRSEASSQWQQCMLLTVILLPTIVVTVLSLLNMIAIYYETINTIPFLVIVKMVLIWLFVAFPLAVAGSMFGRHWGGKKSFPCRVNSIARPIPKGPWYTRPITLIAATGILPFASIFIEMYFIFTSFWNYKFYYVYGFMLLVYLILTIVLACATIVAVYFLLNAEDYRWQWISFLASGSTAIYVFAYSVYYFFFKTEMFGMLQISFYFGYMLLFCSVLFLLCGTCGAIAASIFVNRIYRNIKVD